MKERRRSYSAPGSTTPWGSRPRTFSQTSPAAPRQKARVRGQSYWYFTERFATRRAPGKARRRGRRSGPGRRGVSARGGAAAGRGGGGGGGGGGALSGG